MKKNLPCGLLLTIICCSFRLTAQTSPDTLWQKTLGGSEIDAAYTLDQTSDGGFVIAGGTYSADSNVSVNNGAYDSWIVKLDASGNLLWEKSLGGTSDEGVYSIQQTGDGGFILAGNTLSDNGNVSGNHGGSDYWIVKLNATGELVWQKCLGGTADDHAYSIQEISGGEFIVAGYTFSNDSDVTVNYGLSDFWIVKLNADGNLVWQKSIGGINDDQATSIDVTIDGGFIVAGWSGLTGFADYRVVKLDGNGNIVWDHLYGGSADDQANSIIEISEGGFIVAGHSYSTDSNIVSHGAADYWVVKLDVAGNLDWQQSFGGIADDVANAIQQTSDGGFIIAGKSESIDGDVSENNGKHDFWIVKINSNESLLWRKCLGGSKDDVAFAIQQTTDNGFIVGGWSVSLDGDVTGGNGSRDYWVVRLSSDPESGIAPLSNTFTSIYPNPVETELIINSATPFHHMGIHVYDLQGNQIFLPITFNETSIAPNATVHINTTALQNGFYMLHIINNKTGEREAGKFVKLQ